MPKWNHGPVTRLQALRRSDRGYEAEVLQDDGTVAECVFSVTEVDGIAVASPEPDIFFPHGSVSVDQTRQIVSAVIAFAKAAD